MKREYEFSTQDINRMIMESIGTQDGYPLCEWITIGPLPQFNRIRICIYDTEEERDAAIGSRPRG